MRAGTLNCKIKIQAPAVSQDELGQPLPASWSDVATVWANIRHQNGIEAMKADSPTSVVKASIRIRYRTGINSGMQVVHGDTVYNILAALPDVVTKNHLDLVCEVVS